MRRARRVKWLKKEGLRRGRRVEEREMGFAVLVGGGNDCRFYWYGEWFWVMRPPAVTARCRG